LSYANLEVTNLLTLDNTLKVRDSQNVQYGYVTITASNGMNHGWFGTDTAIIGHAFAFSGIYTAQTSAMPTSLVSSNINDTSASNPQRANFWFELKNTDVFW
jgi:hypothetical protein